MSTMLKTPAVHYVHKQEWTVRQSKDSHTVPALACDSKITTLASSLFTCKPEHTAQVIFEFAALQKHVREEYKCTDQGFEGVFKLTWESLQSVMTAQ